MNAGNVVMGAAGFLASLFASMLSTRCGQSQWNRPLLMRIRIAAQTLLSGKELESFFCDYCDLLVALGKLAGAQCLAFLIFTLPTAGFYFAFEKSYDFIASVPQATTNVWLAPHELIFMVAFMVGSIFALVRRRL